MRRILAALSVAVACLVGNGLLAQVNVNTGGLPFTATTQYAQWYVDIDFGATAHTETLALTLQNTAIGFSVEMVDCSGAAAANDSAAWNARNLTWNFPAQAAGSWNLQTGGGPYVTPSLAGVHRFQFFITNPTTPVNTITLTVSNGGATTATVSTSGFQALTGNPASGTPGAISGTSSTAYVGHYVQQWEGIATIGAAVDKLQFECSLTYPATATALNVSLRGIIAATPAANQVVFELYSLADNGGTAPVATFTLTANGTTTSADCKTFTTGAHTGSQKFRVVVKGGTTFAPSHLLNFQVTWSGVPTFGTAPTGEPGVVATTPVVISPAGGALAPGATISTAWTSTTVISASGGTGSPTNYTWSLPNGPAWVSIVQTSPTNNITLTGTPPTGTAASVNIVVRATNGTTGEWDQETFTLAVSGGSTNTVSIAATAASASEPSTNGTFTITFNPATTVSTDISFTVSGTATQGAGSDYTLSASAGTLGAGGITGIPSGTTTLTITVTVNDDVAPESTETVIITLTSATAGYSVATAPGNTATVNIADNDSTTTVSIAATAASASEPSTNGTFTVTFSPATTASTDISFTVSGTATQGAGSDYTLSASAGTIGAGGITGIPSGTTTVTITVNVVNDTAVESTETVIITLTSATAGYTIGTPTNATVNIADDDTAGGTPVVTIAASGTPSETGPTGGTFTLTATPAPTGNITVNVTWGGTATNGTDYTSATTTTVVIGTSGTATVTFTVIDDSVVDASETVTLTVASGVGYTVGSPSSASRTITDNDGGGGGGGGGTIGGGGGGGGGGCAAETGDTRWLIMLALLALGAVVYRTRKARA